MALQTLPRRIGLMLPVTRLWPSSTQLTPIPKISNSVQKACALEVPKYSAMSPQADAIRRTVFFVFFSLKHPACWQAGPLNPFTRVRLTARKAMAVASTPARKVTIRICMGVSEGTYSGKAQIPRRRRQVVDRTLVQRSSHDRPRELDAYVGGPAPSPRVRCSVRMRRTACVWLRRVTCLLLC